MNSLEQKNNLGAAYAGATGGAFAALQSAGAAGVTVAAKAAAAAAAAGAAHASSGKAKRKCKNGEYDDYCYQSARKRLNFDIS